MAKIQDENFNIKSRWRYELKLQSHNLVRNKFVFVITLVRQRQ